MHLPRALFRTDGAGLATLASPRLGLDDSRNLRTYRQVGRRTLFERRLKTGEGAQGSISHHTHVSVNPAGELLESSSRFTCGWKAANPRGWGDVWT